MITLTVKETKRRMSDGIYQVEEFSGNGVKFAELSVCVSRATYRPECGNDIGYDELESKPEVEFVQEKNYECKDINEVAEWLECWDNARILKSKLELYEEEIKKEEVITEKYDFVIEN